MTATPGPIRHDPPGGAPPIDAGAVHSTVERALLQGPAPKYEDLVELEQLLRGHVQQLLPLAERFVDTLWRGGVDWYDKRAAVDIARSRLREGMGSGLVSAHVHVRQLAYSCRVLLHYAETTDR